MNKILYYVLMVAIFLISIVAVTFKIMFYYKLYQFIGG